MKNIFTILLAVFMASVLLAGCQATPDEPVVIQKDLEQMIKKAGATDEEQTTGISLRERTGAPETLALETTKGNFTLSVNAAVIVPDADKMPIVRIKAGEFTQEQVTAYWNVLVGDTVLWENPTEMTKSEIEAQLVAYRKSIAAHENDPDLKVVNEQIKANITYLEKIYSTAPDTIEKKQADSTLKRMENRAWGSENAYGWYMGTAGNADDYAMGFNVRNMLHDDTGETQNTASMSFGTRDASYNYGQKGTIEVDENTQLDESLRKHIKTTPAEAKTLVEDFLYKTNTPMTIYAMTFENDEETGIYDGVVAPAEHYAYRIACIRMVEGSLPCARIKGSTHVQTNEPVLQNDFISAPGIEAPGGYMKRWTYETMEFMVNDNGIISMSWRAPLELLETKVEDSALIPFSEIQSVFEKMMQITYEAQAEGMDNLTCDISEVSLEMMRVVEQGSIENGLLIPVWNFYGVRSRTYKGKTDETARYVLLCVNAIDGSVIDISNGY